MKPYVLLYESREGGEVKAVEGDTRDEALAPVMVLLERGWKVPPYRVVVDLDALFADQPRFRHALFTDPTLRAVYEYGRLDGMYEPGARQAIEKPRHVIEARLQRECPEQWDGDTIVRGTD